MTEASLDLVTIGRSSVDLYGQQIGGRLEDMASFSKAVGGCPANIAIGTARLGLRSALISRVGDEHFGRFIREQLEREGVETTGLRTDTARLTALAVLGVRDSHSFPLIFYRGDCADGALDESDIDPALLARTHAVVVTGTHFARPHSAAAQRKAMRLMHDAGRPTRGRVVFDIDYRPNLWGLAGHGAGEERYIRSETVTGHLAGILGECDLIVGTEEELHIAGGSENTLDAIRAVRAHAPNATIVCKRGPMGCVVFTDDIPEDIEDGIKGPGFPVEVYNTLGAGDAFMSGFLRGWLRDEPIETCCAWANACGAFAVSRLLCSPESPTFPELQSFLAHGSPHHALRHDPELNHLHWATTRRAQPVPIMALACDHRAQFEQLAAETGASLARTSDFKRLVVQALGRVAAGRPSLGRPGFGIFLDGRFGREALFDASHGGLWIARPVEQTGSRPLEFEEGGSLGARLVEWPADQVVKCLCFYHPDDDEALRLRQEYQLLRVSDACRRLGRDLLVEIIAGKHGPLGPDTVPRVMHRLYDLGIRPDWWKLEPQREAAHWRAIGAVVEARDPLCRGILLLGLEAPASELTQAFQASAATGWVRGFAIGRTIFMDPARDWLSGRVSDEQAVSEMARRFAALVEAWQQCRGEQAA